MKQPFFFSRSPIILVMVMLALGVFFRVTHIGQKVYWHDEVFTSIRAAGYTGEEIEPNVFTGALIPPETLLQYQRLNPDRGWKETWNALVSHPEHPPLYYLGIRFWMERFGSEVAIVRSLSVVLSLLAFPALYWLCREVFPPLPFTAWLAIGLFAVSPFHVLYAQEARQSSLWTLATMLSSAALFRAMRRQTWASWGLYAATIALNLYTFLLSILVVFCQGLVVLWVRPVGKLGRSVFPFLLAGGVGLLAFVPWMIVLIQNRLALNSKTGWTTQSMPRDVLMKLWGLHFSSNFVDSGLPLDHVYTYVAPVLILLLLGYALWLLYRYTPRQTWLYIVLLIALPTIALMLPDMLWGGQRSSQTRYFVPMLVGGQLAMAYLLTHLMQHPFQTQRMVGRGLLALLLTIGIISCGLSWQAQTWWNKGVSYSNAETAEFLNQQHQPVVMSSLGETTLGNVISLSHLVNAQVRFQLVVDPAIPAGVEAGDRFLFFPSEVLVENLQTAYALDIEPIAQSNIALLQLVEP